MYHTAREKSQYNGYSLIWKESISQVSVMPKTEDNTQWFRTKSSFHLSIDNKKLNKLGIHSDFQHGIENPLYYPLMNIDARGWRSALEVKHTLCLQNTQVWWPESMSDSSQTPVTQFQELRFPLTATSGTCTYKHWETNAHIRWRENIFKVKIIVLNNTLEQLLTIENSYKNGAKHYG